MITITPYLKKTPVEKNNYPVFFRLIHERKAHSFQIGINILENTWDDKQKNIRVSDVESWMQQALIKVAENITYDSVKNKDAVNFDDIQEIVEKIKNTFKTLKNPLDIIKFYPKGSVESIRLEESLNKIQ